MSSPESERIAAELSCCEFRTSSHRVPPPDSREFVDVCPVDMVEVLFSHSSQERPIVRQVTGCRLCKAGCVMTIPGNLFRERAGIISICCDPRVARTVLLGRYLV